MKNVDSINSDFALFDGKKSGISIKEILSKYVYHWPLFLLGIVVSMGIAYYYLSRQDTIYNIKSTLLIKDIKTTTDKEVLDEINVDNTPKLVESEMEILKSQDLMDKVVRELQLWVNYSEKQGFNTRYFYKNTPFKFVLIRPSEAFGGQNLNIVINDSKTFSIKGEDGSERVFPIGRDLKSSFGKWRLDAAENLEAYKGRTITMSLYKPEDVATKYQNLLRTSLQNKAAPFINLTITDVIAERGEDVLNCLMNNYNETTVLDKDKLTKSTLNFITSRLDSLTKELNATEKAIEGFRSSRGLTDITSESKAYLDGVQGNDIKLNEINVQLSILNNIGKYISSSQSIRGATTAGISDPDLSALIQKLNDLELERERMLASTPENSPVVEPLNKQITSTRVAIINNISNTRQSLLATKSEIEAFNSKFESSIKDIPGQERELVNIKRKQSIKEDLYIYLLRKREQISLSYASTVVDAKIVNSARSTGVQSPKPAQVYAMFFLIGFILPAGIIFGRSSLNDTVVSRQQIEDELPIPVLGEVIYEESEQPIVVLKNQRTVIAEHFKFLRTNLHYLHGTKEKGRVSMVTSSISGEGKSFVATNLAVSLATSGRKTIILDLDLRKPKLSQIFNLPSTDHGLSDYLDGYLPKERIIRNSGLYSNLDIICCGSILSNPSELLESEKLDLLIDSLKSIYDDIIIDSPPLHLVTDALVISRVCNTTLYVIRQGKTSKSELDYINEICRYQRLPNLTVVFNGIQRSKYGYGYNYDSSYYTEHKAANIGLNRVAYNLLQRF